MPAKHLSSKQRILIVSRNFPPLIGGMEKLIHHVYQGLVSGNTIALVTPNGSKSFISNDTTAYEVKPTPAYQFLVDCQLKSLWAALKFKPDIIISGSGLTAPAALLAGKMTGAPVVTFIHGLDIIVKHNLYQNVFVPAIRASNLVIANSQNTAQLIQQHGINKNKIAILNPGVKLPKFPLVKAKHPLIINNCDIHSRPIILSLGRLTERKGLSAFIKFCFPLILDKVPDALFLIVGDNANQALHSKPGIRTQIENLIKKMDLHQSVLLAGYQDEDQIEKIYANTDVFAFPVIEQNNDVEGFGMVAIEAAAHGIPTVAFAVGGIPDAVKNNQSGFLVDAGNYEKFSDHIVGLLSQHSKQVTQASCRMFAEQFSWYHFNTRLNQYISSVLNHG